MFCTIKLPIKIKNVARFDGRNFQGLRTDDKHVFCLCDTQKTTFTGNFGYTQSFSEQPLIWIPNLILENLRIT